MHKKRFEPDTADQQRVVIALGIVATDIALLALSGTHELVLSLVGGLFFIPAIFSFSFIVLTGSHLKFKRPGEIGEVDIPHRLRRWSYDVAIDSYWYALIVATLSIVAYCFGWNGSTDSFLSYWPTFFISVAVLGSIIILGLVFARKERRTSTPKRASRKS